MAAKSGKKATARKSTKRPANKRTSSKKRAKSGSGPKKKKMGWGGRRPGAGRPKGSGNGPSPNARKNRVAVMFTDTELKKLQALSRKQGIPIATVAYRLIEKSLKRA